MPFLVIDLECESIARVCSNLRVADLVAAIKAHWAFRDAAVQWLLCWETAILDLDPFGRLIDSLSALCGFRGLPNGLVGFFGNLARPGGAWTRRARVGAPPAQLRRRSPRSLHEIGSTIQTPLVLGGEPAFLMTSRFSFEVQPFASVYSEAELRANSYQSIAICASFSVETYLFIMKNVRLVGRLPDGGKPALVNRSGSVLCCKACDLVLENLSFESGDSDFGDGGAVVDNFYPGVQATCAELYMFDCTVEASNGTAVILEGHEKVPACAFIEACTLSSPGWEHDSGSFLGLVLLEHSTVVIKGSHICYNQWGMYVGNDVDEATKTLLLSDNEFHDNVDKDITTMYTHVAGLRVQPWRRGWSE